MLIVYIFYVYKLKYGSYPSLKYIKSIFANPYNFKDDIIDLRESFADFNNGFNMNEVTKVYEKILSEFDVFKVDNDETKEETGVYSNYERSELKNHKQYNLYRSILNYAKNYSKNVEVDTTRKSGASIKLKDGESNTFLAYFAIDKNTNKFNINYRTKQIKKLPFNQVEIKETNIDDIFSILKQILGNPSLIKKEVSLKERIKQSDQFSEYVTETKGLLSHQKAGSILAEKYNRFAFFYDTGTGKTIMALEIMKNKYEKNKTKFLAIVPKPIIKTAWMEDSSKFFPYMKVLPLSKNIKSLDYVKLYNEWNRIDVTGSYIDIDEEMELGIKKIPREKLNFIIKDLKRRAQHFIINMDLFRDKDASEELMKELKFTGIILDESALIKNYDSQSARRMRVLSKKDQIKYFYLLSGKPAPNNDAEYFSQMKIIDPETFHMTRNDFLDEFFTLNNFNKPTAKQTKSKMLAKMVSNRSLVISKEDCLDLPKTTNIVNSVELDTESFKKYASMYQNFVTEVETIVAEGKKVKANSNLASIMKLRQIANGFILDENHIPYQIHDKKISRLEEILEEIGSNQVVIWHNFDYELEMISKLLNKMGKTFVTANGNTKNLDENIKSFKDNKVDIIVANLKTLKYGVTLVNSHYAVYYSVSYSYEDYYQSQARNHRYGQEHECTYFFILSEDTIDINIYNTLIGKESRNNFFESLLKDATKYGVDYKRIKDLISKNRQNKELSKN
jgi:SNF2 family DNA or RNA helicase